MRLKKEWFDLIHALGLQYSQILLCCKRGVGTNFGIFNTMVLCWLRSRKQCCLPVSQQSSPPALKQGELMTSWCNWAAVVPAITAAVASEASKRLLQENLHGLSEQPLSPMSLMLTQEMLHLKSVQIDRWSSAQQATIWTARLFVT